jgi:hypothetical protein
MSVLLKRLTFQLASKENLSFDRAEKMAKTILIKRGHLNKDGTATYAGAVRGAMTPLQRDLDRRARYAKKKKKKKRI